MYGLEEWSCANRGWLLSVELGTSTVVEVLVDAFVGLKRVVHMGSAAGATSVALACESPLQAYFLGSVAREWNSVLREFRHLGVATFLESFQ